MRTAAKLDRILWLGGSACAGKTTIATRLARRYGLTAYHLDDRFDDHRRRADEARHPHSRALMNLTPTDLFAPAPEVQARRLCEFYGDEWEMILEDVAAADTSTARLLVEGAGLSPRAVGRSTGDLGSAVWLIATEDVQRRGYCSRSTLVDDLLRDVPDRDQAFARWMERDAARALGLRTEALAVGARTITVDGSRAVEEIADAVASALGLSETAP